MEPLRDDQLIADLGALRPTPRPQFAAELDKHAAAGFPRRSRVPRVSFDRLRAVQPRRLLIPAAGVALLAVVIATTVVSLNSSGSNSEEIARSVPPSHPETGGRSFDGNGTYEASQHPRLRGAEPTAKANEAAAGEASSTQFEAEAPVIPSESAAAPLRENFNADFNLHRRAVERSAEIVLGAAPEDVADDAAEVFEAVHAHDGIVMRSSTQEGKAGEAGATFDLLIPTAKLGDALAAFSQIDAVRSRHEATADITAPIVTTGELLRESKARVDSLLGQLEGAETESEMEAIEAELRRERRHRTFLRSRLQHLHKRADLSRVSLRIETGAAEEPSSGSGAWSIDDALHDAGHVLTVAAAVTLIALAILGPIALIALLAWLTHRAWVRRERRRVLS
jgi:Domain of unknown function (DUF4349)